MMFKLFFGFTAIFIICTYMSIMFEGGAGPISTRLNGAIGDDDTTLTVDSAAGFVDPGASFRQILYLQNEIVTYTDIAGNDFQNVVRGQFGTSARDHSDNTIVYNEAAGAVNSLAIYNLATELENVGSITGVFHVGVALAKATPSILAWDYAYLEGTNQIIRMILMAFSVGFVAALIGLLIGLAQSIF